jgi:hypothetical protein
LINRHHHVRYLSKFHSSDSFIPDSEVQRLSINLFTWLRLVTMGSTMQILNITNRSHFVLLSSVFDTVFERTLVM